MKQHYEYTLKAFGKDNINKRFEYLLDKVNNFLVSRNIAFYVTVDKRILQELVIDYFSDTERIKDFLTPKNYINKNILAYLGYWIVRKKPLILIKKTDYKMRMKKPFLEYINEWFTFHMILGFKHSPREYEMFFDI